jgi:hypothetical protein
MGCGISDRMCVASIPLGRLRSSARASSSMSPMFTAGRARPHPQELRSLFRKHDLSHPGMRPLLSAHSGCLAAGSLWFAPVAHQFVVVVLMRGDRGIRRAHTANRLLIAVCIRRTTGTVRRCLQIPSNFFADLSSASQPMRRSSPFQDGRLAARSRDVLGGPCGGFNSARLREFGC